MQPIAVLCKRTCTMFVPSAIDPFTTVKVTAAGAEYVRVQTAVLLDLNPEYEAVYLEQAFEFMFSHQQRG